MECPVCYEIFRNPLLLPGCGHTICQNCAELLVTEGNYLRCPECRLVYQLRRGVKSLPKNVALQRTIDEHNKSALGLVTMCESHPEDRVSLYCKTCEKAICLKCYFPNTLRKGEALHSGHQVDTSEDVFSREKVCSCGEFPVFVIAYLFTCIYTCLGFSSYVKLYYRNVPVMFQYVQLLIPPPAETAKFGDRSASCSNSIW